MGGYGALNWALRQPERFAAAASLSGALDLSALADRPASGPVDPALWDRIFDGSPVSRAGTSDDLLWLLDQAADAGTRLPELYVTCGTEDRLYAHNTRFADHARSRDIAVTTDFRPGDHEWGFWDRTIQDVLAWLPRPAA